MSAACYMYLRQGYEQQCLLLSFVTAPGKRVNASNLEGLRGPSFFWVQIQPFFGRHGNDEQAIPVAL